VKIERVKVKVSIPEKEISSIHLGQNITFKVDALNGRHFTGKVVEKGVQANVFSHTYDVKLQLVNSGHMLLPGMVCSVYINNQGKGSAVIIPQEAIMIDGNNTFVWVVKKGGATKRIVKTGGVSDQGTVILDGLESGDAVIVSGQNKVSEGSKIKMV
jgi:RND family efflux transporter MFP subunit